jgi:hypothetical protein
VKLENQLNYPAVNALMGACRRKAGGGYERREK